MEFFQSSGEGVVGVKLGMQPQQQQVQQGVHKPSVDQIGAQRHQMGEHHQQQQRQHTQQSCSVWIGQQQAQVSDL